MKSIEKQNSFCYIKRSFSIFFFIYKISEAESFEVVIYMIHEMNLLN